MRVKSLANSLNVGLIFSSIIQPGEKKLNSLYHICVSIYVCAILIVRINDLFRCLPLYKSDGKITEQFLFHCFSSTQLI